MEQIKLQKALLRGVAKTDLLFESGGFHLNNTEGKFGLLFRP